jgi:hypothetical protein
LNRLRWQFGFAVVAPFRALVRIPVSLSAVGIHGAFQSVLRSQVGGISFVRARHISIRIPIIIAFHAIQIVVRTPRRTIRVRSRPEGRHDWAVASEKSHIPAIMQKYNFRLNGTLR